MACIANELQFGNNPMNPEHVLQLAAVTTALYCL